MISLSSTTLHLFALIGGLLLVAGIIIAALRPLQIAGYANIVLRYRTWWVIVLVFAGGIAAHPLTAFTLMSGLSLWALREYYRLLPSLRGSRLPLVGYVAVPILNISASSGNAEWLHLALFGCLLATLLVAVGEGTPSGSIARIGSTMLGIVVIGWTLAHLLVLRNRPDGVTMIVFLALLTALNDILAYVAGRLWGKHQLAPQISPNKTVEGWLGSAFCTLVLASALHWLVGLSLLQTLALGGIVACFGVVGDLTISLFKRDSQIKDTGTGIPGHGGLLDRLDSLLLVVPLSVYALQLFTLISPV